MYPLHGRPKMITCSSHEKHCSLPLGNQRLRSNPASRPQAQPWSWRWFIFLWRMDQVHCCNEQSQHDPKTIPTRHAQGQDTSSTMQDALWYGQVVFRLRCVFLLPNLSYLPCLLPCMRWSIFFMASRCKGSCTTRSTSRWLLYHLIVVRRQPGNHCYCQRVSHQALHQAHQHQVLALYQIHGATQQTHFVSIGLSQKIRSQTSSQNQRRPWRVC